MRISLTDIFEGIERSKLKYSYGADGVPTALLKACICSLVNPLYFIFNLSLELGEFPTYWKNSFITPIHKSGDRSDVANYRGICIQSAIPKLFDYIVATRLSWECKRVIADEQHGLSQIYYHIKISL